MTVLARFPAVALGRERRPASVPWTTSRARRWWRYAVTSVVATAASETTLLLVYGLHLMAASWAAVVASLAGSIPSYAMSRYWIWPEADRRRPGRQAVAYWVVALVSLGLSSLVTGLAAANGPAAGAARLWVVGLAYIGTYGGLWILKFVVYQTLLFHPTELPVNGMALDEADMP
jgi:putative flippase GtrA